MSSILKKLTVQNLTVFNEKYDFLFSSGLNVFVGENGTGKTHILKVLYAVLAALSRHTSDRQLSGVLANKMLGVFKPDEIGGLVSRTQKVQQCTLDYLFNDGRDLTVSFSKKDVDRVDVSSSGRSAQKIPEVFPPVFLPTRELLSIFPGFVSLYDNRHLQFEETWRDCCSLLDEPLIRKSSASGVNNLLRPLEKAMGGKIVLSEAGRFYLRKSDTEQIEIHLVAEGLRKLGMLAKLIVSGVIKPGAALFWDEPEANLNPKLVKTVGSILLQFAQMGIQIFIATHSLFLLRELDILQRKETGAKVNYRYFGLRVSRSHVVVEQNDSIDDIGNITALDESLSQSKRYMDMELA